MKSKVDVDVESQDRNEVLGKVAEGVVSRKPTYMLLPDEVKFYFILNYLFGVIISLD